MGKSLTQVEGEKLGVLEGAVLNAACIVLPHFSSSLAAGHVLPGFLLSVAEGRQLHGF